MCENLVGVTLAVGELQHTEFIKQLFFSALIYAIRPHLLDQVTYVFNFDPEAATNTGGVSTCISKRIVPEYQFTGSSF